MVHIYESHMGGFFYDDEPLDYDYLYCDTCGDSDNYLGTASDKEEAWRLMQDLLVYYDEDYIKKFIDSIVFEEVSYD